MLKQNMTDAAAITGVDIHMAF